jgi:hypothetical protein
MKFSVYHLTIPRELQIQERVPMVDDIMFGFDPLVRMLAVVGMWNKPDTLYTRVADVEVADLESVFNVTNHIDHSWTENDEVVALFSQRPRSTSVGDVVVDSAGNKFFVDSFGFKEF